MSRITDVVKNLLIINALVYFGAQILLGPGRGILAFHAPGSGAFEPFQIISHMFMHGDLGHLFFNMFALFILGPMVETYIGPKKFLFFYFFCGLGALLTHLASFYLPAVAAGVPMPTQFSVWGASGAVYGVVIAFATLFPNQQLMLLFPPIPIRAKYLAIGIIGIGLYMGLTGAQDGVAHFAHLGGAAFGFFLTRYWQKQGLWKK